MSVPEIRTVHDVRWAKECLGFAIDECLQRAGWKRTCQTPGSFWLWEKVIDGRSILVSQDMAVAMQCRLEPNPAEEEGAES